MAYGPSFKQQLLVEAFDNIEVYNLMSGASNDTIPRTYTTIFVIFVLDGFMCHTCIAF